LIGARSGSDRRFADNIPGHSAFARAALGHNRFDSEEPIPGSKRASAEPLNPMQRSYGVLLPSRDGTTAYSVVKMGAVSINMPVLHDSNNANSRGLGSRAAGFTLLELLVVMVIIGLLAGFVAPRYFSQVGKSQVKAAKAQVDALDKAIEQFRLDMNRLPTSEEGLAALQVSPANEPNWAGPYLKKDVPKDPWGHPYVYLAPGTHNNDFDLMSYGKDGQPGGTGENADIGNW
jgi:general secretion pathway protein G